MSRAIACRPSPHEVSAAATVSGSCAFGGSSRSGRTTSKYALSSEYSGVVSFAATAFSFVSGKLGDSTETGACRLTERFGIVEAATRETCFANFGGSANGRRTRCRCRPAELTTRFGGLDRSCGRSLGSFRDGLLGNWLFGNWLFSSRCIRNARSPLNARGTRVACVASGCKGVGNTRFAWGALVALRRHGCAINFLWCHLSSAVSLFGGVEDFSGHTLEVLVAVRCLDGTISRLVAVLLRGHIYSATQALCIESHAACFRWGGRGFDCDFSLGSCFLGTVCFLGLAPNFSCSTVVLCFFCGSRHFLGCRCFGSCFLFRLAEHTISRHSGTVDFLGGVEYFFSAAVVQVTAVRSSRDVIGLVTVFRSSHIFGTAKTFSSHCHAAGLGWGSRSRFGDGRFGDGRCGGSTLTVIVITLFGILL